MPRVSVIVPTFNRAALLAEALASVRASTCADYELLVIDDGSTDDTRTVALDAGARYIYQANAGAAAARNRGMALATGDYLAFLDSDDLFTPDKLARTVAHLDAHPDHGLVYSGYTAVDAAGAHLRTVRPSLSGDIARDLLWACPIATPTVLLRRSLAARVGLFDTRLRLMEDVDYGGRAAFVTRVGGIPDALTVVRFHAAATSRPAADILHAGQTVLGRHRDALPPLLYRRLSARAYFRAGVYALPDVRAAAGYLLGGLASWPFDAKAAYLLWRMLGGAPRRPDLIPPRPADEARR